MSAGGWTVTWVAAPPVERADEGGSDDEWEHDSAYGTEHEEDPPAAEGEEGATGITRSTLSARAGLTFPVGRIYRRLQWGPRPRRTSRRGAIFLTAVMEYLAVELLELAGNVAADFHKTRITANHVEMAISTDNELRPLVLSTPRTPTVAAVTGPRTVETRPATATAEAGAQPPEGMPEGIIEISSGEESPDVISVTDTGTGSAGPGAMPPLSSWNAEQRAQIRTAERRRWATVLTLGLEAVRGPLSAGWAARLERQSAAFSFIIYRYRGYLDGPLRRQLLGHRAVVNALTRLRRGEISREALGNEVASTILEEPFGVDEARYRDPRRANVPRNSGRWSWVPGDIAEDRTSS